MLRVEDLQQHVLDDDGDAERDEQRRQEPAAQGEVEQAALQAIAQHEHHRHHDDEARERMHAGRVDRHQRDIGGEHDEIAMRDVDEPHDAEGQRQADGEERIEPAQQRALDEDVEPIHRARLTDRNRRW